MFNLLNLFGSGNISAQNCPERSEGPPLAGLPLSPVVYPGKRAAMFCLLFLDLALFAVRCACDPWPRSSGPDRIFWVAHSRIETWGIRLAHLQLSEPGLPPGTVRQVRHRGGIFPPIAARQTPNFRRVRGFLPHGAGPLIAGVHPVWVGIST
ncbi:hypothetical protein ES703_44177 [subsurface metagenome]